MTALPFAYSLQADGSATATRHPGTLDNAQLCSGAGQFHTNEPDPSNPGKRLTPYNPITWQDVLALVDTPQQVDKGDAQWLIPSTLHSRSFAAQEQRGEYWALWFDLDTAPPSADALMAAMPEVIGAADFEVYSSKSATPERPKWRGLIPLSEPLSGSEWTLAQEVINDRLEAQGITPDRVSQRTAQLCYLPNRGEHYQSHSKRDGVRFNALAELGAAIEAKRQQQREAEARLGAEREAAAAKRASLRMADAPDAIGAFNRAYSVQEVLAQAGYKQRGNTFCHPNSASGSYSASVRDGRVHSLSGSDPLYTGGGGGGAHDAFSAFTVLFHGGDRSAALRDAGDNWLSVGGESWNKAKQREWAQQQSGAAPGDFWHLSDGTLPQGIAPAGEQVEQHHLTRFIDIGQQPEPPAWILPGFVAEGLVMIAGGHGVGKTTAVLPLALATAGVHPPQYELAPAHWRHVVYITEDVAQAGRIVAGYGEHLDWPGGRGVPDRIRERLHVVEAQRAGAGYVVQAGDYYREHFTRTVTTTGADGRQYTAELLPLVVIDTLAATIHLDNENDNSEASAAIAALKQRFAGLPVWIIGHTAKANLSRSETITARGASAFEADANQVLYLVNEGQKGRWLIRGKTRFEAKWQELEIHSDSRTVTAVNRFGDEESLTLRWAVAVPPEQGRAQRIEQAKTESAERDREALRARILLMVADAFADGKRLNKTALRSQVGGNATTTGNCIDALLADGWLFEVEIPAPDRLKGKPSFLVALDESERQAFTATGELPAHKLTIPPDWRKQPEPKPEPLGGDEK